MSNYSHPDARPNKHDSNATHDELLPCDDFVLLVLGPEKLLPLPLPLQLQALFRSPLRPRLLLGQSLLLQADPLFLSLHLDAATPVSTPDTAFKVQGASERVLPAACSSTLARSRHHSQTAKDSLRMEPGTHSPGARQHR